MEPKYYKCYCSDIENVENYEKAKADNFKGWHCHHRLETHTSDGERRPVDISMDELKALGMYYNRPSDELIFLTVKEHNAFKKGKKPSEETRKKLSEANKDKNNPFYGKRHSEETKKKMRCSWDYDKHFSEETKKKLSEASKGNKHFLGKKHSEETKKKMSKAKKGTHWFNNGKICIRAKECPQGFIPGRLR